MERKDYLNKVKQIMITKNPYGEYHKKNFDDYSNLGEMAPINKDIIKDMPKGQIVLSEKIYEILQDVSYSTNFSCREIPFFLYGKEIPNNSIFFTEFFSSSNNRSSNEADFNEKMKDYLEDKIRNNKNNGFVVCHGHSHPPVGDYHENFSLGDFTSYLQMNQDNEVFKNRQVELMGCLVTSTGDINFIYYDNKTDNFYRFTDVIVKGKNGTYRPINCYGLNQENSSGMNRR